jgi:hypothetical protein
MKRIADLTPEQRRDAMEHSKLSPVLLAKLAAYRKARSAKPETLEVQVWIGGMSASDLAKLKSLGFNLQTTLTPGRLLLGTISITKLDDLLKQPCVQLVELPKFKG